MGKIFELGIAFCWKLLYNSYNKTNHIDETINQVSFVTEGVLPLDIASLSTALAQTKTQNDVGVLMLSKSLDLTETLGEGMVEILDASAMENSVTPHLGSNIDCRI